MLLTAGCSVFGVNYNTEEASYRLLTSDDDFEIRLYQPMVVAETIVNGDFDSAGSQAFRKLFAYISGDNAASSKIAMTAPVIVDPSQSVGGQVIEMTVPVLEESSDEGWRYMFVLPEQYTLGNAPAPLNEDVTLTAEPSRKVAVLRFSGLINRHKLQQKIGELRQWLAENELSAASEPRWAGYNPPWTLPFMRRNEVMIEVN